ncbi:MAG: hemolysin III family protein, partial [Ilumatobacteraceae bacterium]
MSIQQLPDAPLRVPDAPGALDVALGSPGRPSWRGRLHLIALLSAIPVLIVLAIESSGARARAAVIMYAIGLCAMLAVSTTYHRWVHTIRARSAWRRADHATIFAAIAGTFAALALICLGTGPAIATLILVWGAATASAVVKIFWFDRAHRFGSAMYIGLGWAGIAIAPALWQRGGVPTVALVLA